MRRFLVIAMSLATVALAGCGSKPTNGECKSSDDCKEQTGFGKVCVANRCQECGADTDCQSGFVCRDSKCAPRPECKDAVDCGEGKVCQNEKCVAAPPPPPECQDDAGCGSGKACQEGKCVVAAAPATAGTCGGEDKAVHFAFDKSDLDATARAALEQVAGCLKSTPGNIQIEGHCDERGTTEYNLHLGERRAEAVRKYLGNLGIEAARMKITSYGKERPLCTEQNESCWSKNRRGVIVGG